MISSWMGMVKVVVKVVVMLVVFLVVVTWLVVWLVMVGLVMLVVVMVHHPHLELVLKNRKWQNLPLETLFYPLQLCSF